MRYRMFGRSGLRVSELVLGTMVFGHHESWGDAMSTSLDDCRAVLDAYAEAGGNVVDTANRYTEGRSEEVVGELVEGRRDRFVLSTKYTLSVDGDDPNASGNHRKSLVRSLEQSLRRLRTDYVDILWVHIWDPYTPIEETMRALDDVVRAGKVLYIGVSDTPAWVVARANALAEARGWTSFTGLQVPYSLAQRDVERELLPMARAHGMAVTAWSPLAGGLLTGKYLDGTAGSGSRLSGKDIPEGDLAIAREVVAVAGDLGVSPAQVAIAWTRARSRDVHPIVAARTAEQLRDNLAAVDVTLPDEALTRLDAVSAIPLGFPHDFGADSRGFVFGPVDELVDAPA